MLGIQRTGHQHDHSTHSTSHSPNLYTASSVQQPTNLEIAAISASNALHAVHPRPANPHIVSWPHDPAPAFLLSTANAPNDEAGQPGQYIYYMPLGHEGGKGENKRAWTHGWGDRFNTFWCCYGTAVESFSKLTDSIYFWWDPKDTTEDKNSEDNTSNDEKFVNNKETLGGSLNSNSRPPSLFVNQFVSSTLNWRDLGVVVNQTADLYGSNVQPSKENADSSARKNNENIARSKIEISIHLCPNGALSDEDCDGDKNKDGNKSKFYLHWRVPSWVDANREMALTMNGRALDMAALPRARSNINDGADGRFSGSTGAAGSGGFTGWLKDGGFHPPEFGNGADYVILGPDWKDGDTGETLNLKNLQKNKINSDFVFWCY